VTKEKCNHCYNGETVNFDEYEYEFDKLYDGGQFSAYEIFLQLKRKYKDGAVKCTSCNGTGFKQELA